ncbi:hypothetical protein Tco_1056702 [Tanacetum coccineum]|uniref:Retrotransposon gag domain-containing protein n=1 Tax=Tanacetum coccineum TaxID=301880 RepID=A0ABQ5H3W7_9ASTR
MSDNTTLLQALQAIQLQLQQQSQQLQQLSQQQSQQQIEQNTKILEALNMNPCEQPKHDHNLYGSSSDEDEEGDQVDPANHQRNQSQVKYVAYKLRGAASSWWDNLQICRRRQRKQPLRTSRNVIEYSEVASCDQLSESDAH